MAHNPDDLVCRLCGVKLTWWRGHTWKHATGGRGAISCGRTPVPVTRAAFDAEMSAVGMAMRILLKG